MAPPFQLMRKKEARNALAEKVKRGWRNVARTIGVASQGDIASGDSLRVVTIPLYSTILCRPAEVHQQKAYLTLQGSIEIQLNENLEGESSPYGSKWPGPWFGVYFPGVLDIDASTGSRAELSRYTPRCCQIRVATSLRPSCVITCSPCPGHPQDEDRASDTLAQGSWDITTQHHGGGNEDAGKGEGVLWEYNIRPGQCDNATARIKRTPKAVFGYDRAAGCAMPRIEVEVVVHWSLRSTKRSWRRRLASFLRTSTPDIAELVHHASVVVDLGKDWGNLQKIPSHSWVSDADTSDEQTTTAIVAAAAGPISFETLSMTLANDFKTWKVDAQGNATSDKILFKRAVEGRITSRDRVLPSLIRRLLVVPRH